MGDGRTLLAGKRGERWLLDPQSHALAAGANLAPEDLIAVLDADNGYWFVGQSGTSYEARDPLGKFLRSSAPLEPLIRVSAARHSIIGIPADRSLSRSADGAASFSRVGPAKVAFADVELAGDGTGLALSLPEALWLTRDEGATWSELPGKTHGAFALSRDRQGHLRIDTVFGPYRFVDRPPRLEPGLDPASAQELTANAPPRGPDAAALADGRAIVLGNRYWEVAASPAHPSDYELWQGPLDGKLEASPLPQLKDCRGGSPGWFRSQPGACLLSRLVRRRQRPDHVFAQRRRGRPFRARAVHELRHSRDVSVRARRRRRADRERAVRRAQPGLQHERRVRAPRSRARR